MLKEQDDNYNKSDKYDMHDKYAIDPDYHRVKIQALVNGSLDEAEGLAYLRRLSCGAGSDLLDLELFFKLTIDAVRLAVRAESAQLFAQAGKLIDCCGTGGSGLSHYNTSTTVAFILAAAGLKTAKFGNRAASSQSGSFDFLDKLGIGTTLPLRALPELLQKTNLTFLFAPQFYPALAALAPMRRAVGQPTVFNYIGPLLNPAEPVYRLIGAPHKQAQKLIAGHLQTEGKVEHALIVNAQSGLDELDVYSTNSIFKVTSDRRQTDYDTFTMDTVGIMSSQSFTTLPQSKLDGKREGQLTVDDNVKIFKALITAELSEHNYYHALVCLNAAGALIAAREVDNWEEGAKVAARLIKDGSVKAKFVQYQNQFK